MCLYPKLILNKKYTANKKNGGVIPPVFDKRVLRVPTACGKCMECRKAKAREWQVRLTEDIKINKNGKFVCFTFSDESYTELREDVIKQTKGQLDAYETDNEICTLAIRRFRGRWKKKHKYAFKRWLVTELGHNGTENVHMHGIIWTDHKMEEINKIWGYGRVIEGDGFNKSYVNEATINYCTKYILKTDEKHMEYKPKILTSPGVGSGYENSPQGKLNIYKKEKTNESYTSRNGRKMTLPVYYRNKIYSEEEREKLWIEKLNKQTRYVDGVEIDISKTDKRYFQALKQAREKSKRLGYGDDKSNWDRKTYELQRRILMQEKRRK